MKLKGTGYIPAFAVGVFKWGSYMTPTFSGLEKWESYCGFWESNFFK
jgi:hypothetical protein